MLTIEVTSGPGEGAGQRRVEAPFTIGRDPLCTIALDDARLAAEQAQVFREGSEFFLQDLNGATAPSRIHRGAESIELRGTQAVALRHGDIVHLGPPAHPVAIAVTFDDEQLGDDVPVNATGALKLADFEGVAAELARDGRTAPRLLAATQKLARRGVDKREVFEGVAEAVFDLLPRASHVAIALAEADFKTVFGRGRSARTSSAGPAGSVGEAGAREQIRVPQAVVARVRQLGDAMITADTAAALAAPDDTITVQRIKSTVAAPLWDGTTIRGVLHAFNLGDGRDRVEQFTLDDMSLLVTLAAQAALAIENASLVERLRIAEEKLRGENRYLKNREEKRRSPNIVGESASMLAIFKQIERVKDTDAAVCIVGETGTGKELIASAIHYQSSRRDKLFVAQNCAAIPETLLESELFGHKRGAFTGADRDKQGLFELADGGTLFLDEIGEMSLGLQAKLLRVLQDRQVRPVGATQARTVNVRIISATNRALEKEVERGAFRQDLYYRLHQYPIRVPPLRERRDDIPELFQHFLRRFSEELKKPEIDILPEAMDQLRAYNWPGNIRELENECMRLVIQADPDTYITPDMLAPQIRKVEELLGRVAPERPKGTLKDQMEEIERHLLTEALREHGGNKTKTAETLGITREGLHKKLSKYGM